MFRKIFRWIGKIVLGITGIAILLYAVLVIINLFDEDICPDAARWLKPTKVSLAAEDNVYYLLMGIEAPEGEDAFKNGKKLIDGYKRDVNAGKHVLETDNFEQPLTFDFGPKNEPGKRKKGNKVRTSKTHYDFSVLPDDFMGRPFVDLVLGDKDRYLKLEKLNTVLMKRYAMVRGYSHFLEDVPFSFYVKIPKYYLLLRAQELKFAGVVFIAEEQSLERALLKLKTDLEFWALLAGKSDFIIGKLVGLRGLRNGFALLANLLAAYPVDDQGAALAEQILGLLGAEQLNFAPSFKGEYKLIANAVEYMETQEDSYKMVAGTFGLPSALGFLLTPLHQENDTLNNMYRHFSRMDEISRLPMRSMVSAAEKCSDELEKEFNIGWHYVKNPVGKMLLAMSMPNLHAYPARGHDLKRIALMIEAQVKVRKEQPRNVEEYINALGEKYRDPLTGEAFEYDPGAKALRIALMADGMRNAKNIFFAPLH